MPRIFFTSFQGRKPALNGGGRLVQGVWGTEFPPAGSRGGARGRGPGGTKSPEAEAILYFFTVKF